MEKTLFTGNCIEVKELKHGVKKIILNRPDIRNAFNETMIKEIIHVLDLLKKIQNINEMRLLLIEGSGKVFCAGADLSYMKALADKQREENLADATLLAQMFYDFVSFELDRFFFELFKRVLSIINKTMSVIFLE